MRMCFTGIIGEYCCHGSATRVSQAPLGDKQMTCLHYASIAYTLVNPVNRLFSYARYSYADECSMLHPLLPDSSRKRCAYEQRHVSKAHKLALDCDTHVTWIRLAHAPETVFPYPRQRIPRHGPRLKHSIL